MKKIILFSIIIGAVALFPVLISAQSSLEGMMDTIRKSQNVSQNSKIECDNVSEQNFEELGDAVMDVMHPDEQQHELMDQMMGGEGSQSLKAAHIYMGKQYLGCVSGTSGLGMMGGGGYGMMGSGMMGNYGTLGGGMMGGSYYGWNWFGLIFQVLVLALVILAVVALIKWLSKQDKK